MIVLIGPSLYSYVEEKITPPTKITYDIALPLSVSSGLAARPSPMTAGTQYIAGLNALYYDLASIQQGSRKLLIEVLADAKVFLGSNITILPLVTDARSGDIAVWMVSLVFLVDPQGQVRAGYPPGDVPFFSVRDYPSLSNDVSDALNKGRLAFTYGIPLEPSSLGTWMIVVLLTDYLPGASTSIIAGTKAWFEVLQTPVPLWDSPIDLLRLILSMLVAPFMTVYAILSVEETKKLAALLARNWIFVAGIVAMLVAFYLSYLAP